MSGRARPSRGRMGSARRRRCVWPGLEAIARATEVRDRATLVVGGRVRGLAPDGVELAGEEAVLAAVAQVIYQEFHCRLAARPARPVPPPAAADHFAAALSRANTGRGTWEPGWAFESEADGQAVVSRDGVRFWASRDVVRLEPGRGGPGAAARVRVGKERRQAVAGFYLALGDAEAAWTPRGPAPTVRTYWNLEAEGASELVRLLTGALNLAGIPFTLKVPHSPDGFWRADAGVLYLASVDFARATPSIRRTHRALRRWLRDEVPLLARRLAPGLALAEDPAGEASFGEHRARLVAEALWSAFRRGRRRPEGRLAELTAAFRRAGVDPARPYLSPGSSDHAFG